MKRVTGLLLLLICLRTSPIVYADLHDPNNSADYLIVSTSEVIQANEWIQNLADWRDDHGRVSMIVSTEEIFDEFGTGIPSDTVLKEFLHYARLNWSPPQLQDVFFIGHDDVVPSHREETGIDTFLSDYYYSFDDDLHDPILNIGRLPWAPAAGWPLFDYAQKIEGYELAEADPWQTRVIMIADDQSEFFVWGSSYGEPLSLLFPAFYTIEREYADYSPGDPWYGDRTEIAEHWNDGAFAAFYFGFGGPEDFSLPVNYWSDSMQLDSSFFGSLTNGPRLPIVVDFMRTFTPAPDGVSPLAWSLLANPDGGAVAVFGINGATFFGASLAYRTDLIASMTDPSIGTLGDLWRVTADSAVEHTSFRTAQQTALLGDPGLRLPDRTEAADDPVPPSLPQSIELLGNYPNPFNGTTTIRYALPAQARITLTIYNLEGRQVATLVDDLVTAGEHAVQWNANVQASGIYFAMLKSGSVTQTAKLIYLK